MPDDPRRKNALFIGLLDWAVRCSKEEKIEQLPRVIYKGDDSVRLTKMVLKRIERDESW